MLGSLAPLDTACKLRCTGEGTTTVRNTVRLPLVALALALAAALTLAACGGGGGGDATKVVNLTFSGAKKVRSGQLNLALTINARGVSQLGGPVSIKLTGPFQTVAAGTLPQFNFDLALASPGGRAVSAGAISTGTQGFLKFQGQAYAVQPNVFAAFKQGYERAQQQSKQQSQQRTLSSFGVNPRNWLKDAKTEGDADVAGTTTTHVSSKVDVPKLLADLNRILQQAGKLGLTRNRQVPSGITPQQSKTIQNAIKDARFDLYSGKTDHILRRMVVKLSFDVPPASRSRAGGLSGGNLTFELTLGGLNQAQTITPPASARPFGDLAAQLRQALGTSAGTTGSGSTTAPSTGSGAAGNAKAQRYLQCLQQAGGDVSKAQKCATLLNG
jgi:hypothetical protein